MGVDAALAKFGAANDMEIPDSETEAEKDNEIMSVYPLLAGGAGGEER
jgi:hypothetical protein